MKHVSYPVNPCSGGRGGVCEGEIERGNGGEEREAEEEGKERKKKGKREVRKRGTCRHRGGKGDGREIKKEKER